MFRSMRSQNASAATEINMAPLIDMIFILLIFFLVTTTFSPESGLNIDKPSAATGESLSSRAIRISLAADGQLFMDAIPLELNEVSARIRQALDQRAETFVVIVPDKRAEAGRLVELMDAARAAGARDIAVAALTKGEEP
jgi:biopolymer transport protein ExbD